MPRTRQLLRGEIPKRPSAECVRALALLQPPCERKATEHGMAAPVKQQSTRGESAVDLWVRADIIGHARINM